MNKDDFLKNKFLRECEINKAQATPGPFDSILILDHLKSGYNIGKIIRSAEVLGVKAVYILGTKFFDPTPAKGALKRVPVFFYPHFKDIYSLLSEQGYELLALHPEGETFLGANPLPKKSAFILGHEGFGFTFKLEDFLGIQKIKIQQWGKTQSLNVAVAASIALYEYSRIFHGSLPQTNSSSSELAR
jgi:tRNA G18 (ribose-2'-O)-methylase SpoU